MMRRRPVALATLLGVLFLTFLDTTVVSVTLGDMQYDLGAGVIGLQWVVDAYALVFASLMLVAGSLGDRYGRKPVMLVGMAVFCGGSVLCALAPGIGWVITGRAVMGVGAAASEPGTLSIVRQLYPDDRQRARALGAWSAVSGLALALGPVLGGLLVDLGGWRAVFWFNLALGALLLMAAARFVPDSKDLQSGRVDAGGFVLGAGSLGSLIYATIAGEQYGYGSWWIVTLFAVGGACLVGFVVVERRVAAPMLDLAYLREPTVGAALFAAFAVYFGVFSIFFLTALYLDLGLGYSGGRLAAVFTPMAVAIVAGAVAAGRWTGTRGPRAPLVTGCLLGAGGIVAARHVLNANPSFPALAFALALAGLGFGVAVVPLTAAVLSHVPAERSGMAASATNTARQLGSVVGVAALGAIVDSYLTNDFGASLGRQGASVAARDYIVGLLETGGRGARGFDIAHPPPLLAAIVHAAVAAFRDGLHTALLTAAVLIVLAALGAALARDRVR